MAANIWDFTLRSLFLRFRRLYEKLGRYGRAAELYVKYTADVQSICDETSELIADRDDAEDLGHAYLYLSKYYLLHRIFDKAFEEAKAAEVFREVKDEAHSMLKQISRMQAEAHEYPNDYKHVEPARLGFPLWKKAVHTGNPDTEDVSYCEGVPSVRNWQQIRENLTNLLLFWWCFVTAPLNWWIWKHLYKNTDVYVVYIAPIIPFICNSSLRTKLF